MTRHKDLLGFWASAVLVIGSLLAGTDAQAYGAGSGGSRSGGGGGGGGGSGGGGGCGCGSCPDPDHPDEFNSFSTISGTELAYLTGQPEVAVLKRGFWDRMAGMLARSNVSVLYADEDFNPVELRKHVNVLLVPSGGFIYLGNNVSFKLRLAQFISAGGTVIVMTQQTAGDWKVLPGSEDLEAIGYSDEVNWYRVFMYWDQYSLP